MSSVNKKNDGVLVKVKLADFSVKRLKIPQKKYTRDESLTNFLEEKLGIELTTEDYQTFHEIDESFEVEEYEFEEIEEDTNLNFKINSNLTSILDLLIENINNSNQQLDTNYNDILQLNLENNITIRNLIEQMDNRLIILELLHNVIEDGEIVIKSKKSIINIILNIVNIILLIGLMILAILI